MNVKAQISNSLVKHITISEKIFPRIQIMICNKNINEFSEKSIKERRDQHALLHYYFCTASKFREKIILATAPNTT